MGNPLEKPAMTQKDQQQVTQGPASQQALAAPAINIVIHSGCKLKHLFENDPSSPDASQ